MSSPIYSIGAWNLFEADPLIAGVLVALFAVSGVGYVVFRVLGRGKKR